ncbi:MAG: Na/Pi cotransporter family protein [Spirochaetota bacterium]
MSALLLILNLIGGLGIFLVGMRWMSDGIHRRAGNRLRSILHRLTSNRVAGALTGLGVTSLVQSSSATTVLLVSLVNVGLVTLRQSIGVVMGANVGTTLTAWIVSLVGFKVSITDFALPAIAIALPFHFSKNQSRREFADILIGFGLLFLGLHLMKESVPDIRSNPEILSFLQYWSGMGYVSVLIFIVVGTVLTVVVQSSSAAMAITITMAFQGWISFPIAAAIVLGENIGTTITAFLASLPMNASAKRTARAHMLFNLFGVAWMLAVFFPFVRLVDLIFPGSASDPANIPLHLSLFHTLFNVANTFILLPFVDLIALIVERMVPERREVIHGPYRLNLVPSNMPEALESNLITIRRELCRMAERASTMLRSILDVSRNPATLERVTPELELVEQRVDEMQEEITRFLTESMRLQVSDDQARYIQATQRIAHELEGITDACFSIGLLLKRLHKKGRRIHDDGDQELNAYIRQVTDFLSYNRDYLERKFEDYDMAKAFEMEERIDKVRNRLRKRSRKSIEQDAESDVKGELLFIDIVRHLEHIGDHSLNISEAAVELA